MGRRPDLAIAVDIPKLKRTLYFGVWLNDIDGSVYGIALSEKEKEKFKTIITMMVTDYTLFQKVTV